MLRLGRRRNVHVVLATQAIGSLPETVSDAVWTNVADFVAFRGSPEEAREFSRVARGIAPESILSLPRGEAAALVGKGNSVHWIRSARIPGTGRERRQKPEAPDVCPSDRPPASTSASATTREPTVISDRENEGDPGKVLLAIARRVEDSGSESPVRVSLTELRREVDPTGAAVRAAGGILGRSGALVRTGRDQSGPCWWIDPSRIERVDRARHNVGTETGSDPPQPS
jgi:hypothetical protein